ncbi:hypothetical protein [Mucilaginibacter aquariorum]|uniref:Uncharacterized protein n=1 Tax=Mucilaginibacter aquariorum TaxID=2967225 RepID=A0ABT1T419_9SPHI|nr:hypothetical protein [Mucilaginibacter aquariorum]MCQ6959165.1 hypothetical protein [Mucilaginibacter aquariorum]
MIADNPDCKIELKAFHAEILNDHHAIEKEVNGYKELPLIRKIDNAIVHYNYLDIKKDMAHIIQTEMEKLLSNPGLMHLIIKKKL